MINDTLRIGIYGGTFAPVHNGHVMAARTFLDLMQLDLLYVIPAAIPPHKQIDENDDPHHRYRMCELAFAGESRIIVSDAELQRAGKSYTVDTLRSLTAPDRRLFLLVGTDMMLTLDTWREAEEIFKLCYPIYMRREQDPILEARIVEKNAEYQQKYGRIVRRLVGDVIDLSSTAVRNAVREGRDIGKMVPPAVAAYIKEQGLYV